MLIEKQFTAVDNILTFKLLTGEEIVAKCVSENDISYTISKPLTLVSNKQGVALMQTMVTMNTDKSAQLMKSAIALVATPIAEFETYYLETTSGIALAH